MKSKRILALLLSLCLMLTLGACTSGEQQTGAGAAKDGTYSGEAKGFGGPIKVEVTVAGGAITDVKVLENTETQGIGSNAIEQLPPKIVETQSVALDAVSGCTVSSEALLSAVALALADSGMDMDALNTPPAANTEKGEDKTLTTDVVVVGAGLSGISAAIKAKENGADVILVEKMSFTGGNSKLSTGVFFMGGTDIQKAAGIEDTPDAFYDYVMEKSGGKRDPVQVRLIADKGNDALNWLKSIGVEVSDSVSAVMGCPVYRAHQGLPNAPGMIDKMTEVVKSMGIELLLDTPATALITATDGSVTGITATAADGGTLTIEAKSVILAAGGFAASPERIEKYWGLKNLGYAGVPGTTGEMTDAAIALGADTVDIAEPWMTPTVEVTTNTLITSLVISKGAILVTSNGERFCDEAASYAETSDAVFATGEETVLEIFDNHVKDAVYKVPDYIAMGVVTQADTLEELAGKIGVPAEKLAATVDAYNAAVRGEQADPFNREIFIEECKEGPFYSITVKPGTIMSPGGLKIDDTFRVVKTDGTVIPGLYAVGEITGGYRAFGYVGGDSLSHCVVSGMVAGEAASK
ncbi:MAG TPA: flavocytochrome c [Candidatus Acidoferrum sp.]|nr:flavocytochrome c [Candidatus Acidoferrum sp.]